MHPYSQERGTVRWRDAQPWPPASLLLAALEARESWDSETRGRHWRGETVPLPATWDDEAPSLIPHVETTRAPAQEVPVVEMLQHGLADQALLPTGHGVDGAYGSRAGLGGVTRTSRAC